MYGGRRRVLSFNLAFIHCIPNHENSMILNSRYALQKYFYQAKCGSNLEQNGPSGSNKRWCFVMTRRILWSSSELLLTHSGGIWWVNCRYRAVLHMVAQLVQLGGEGLLWTTVVVLRNTKFPFRNKVHCGISKMYFSLVCRHFDLYQRLKYIGIACGPYTPISPKRCLSITPNGTNLK